MTVKPVSLLDLDDDVLIHTFSFLEIADILAMRQVRIRSVIVPIFSSHSGTHRLRSDFTLYPNCKLFGRPRVSATS